MSTDLAGIDPVEAKAFELRRFALDVRRKLNGIEDIDRLRELETVLMGARRRLKQLNEDVIEAERTRVLVVQRIGVLIGPAVTGRPKTSNNSNDGGERLTSGPLDGTHGPIDQSQRDRDYEARMLAAYPSIVERAIALPHVTVSKVFRLCKMERARETVTAAAEMAQGTEIQGYNVQRGQWWTLGEHLLYCGDSTDVAFVERIRQAEPVFAFADPPSDVDGFGWAHDYLTDVVPVVGVTPGIASLVDFARLTRMPYRWTVAAWLQNGQSRGALGFSNWIPVYLFAKEDGAVFHEAQDHLKITIDPHVVTDVLHTVARKPISLLTKLLDVFTSSGDVVVDPFLGSGTTLIAADKTHRVCIGAEVDAVHCGEILRRYGKEVSPLP